MKLFTKEIDKKLFEQYPKGSDLENQMVVAKIFNPYGKGIWYLLNSDPNDSDYIWAIVDLFEVETGSVSRNELETIKVPPFRLGLERDLSFTPINAAELYRGLTSGKYYADGGEIEKIGYNNIITDKSGNKYAIKNWDAQGYIIPYDASKYWEHFQVPKQNWIKIQDINWSKFNISKSDFYNHLDESNKKKLEILNKYKSSFKEGGYMAEGGEFYPDKKRIYFSTLSEVIDAINDIAAENGYDVVEIFPDLTYGGIGYGETKRVKVEVEWNGKEKTGKSKKREKNTLNVSIYRMDSGNYELNTYFAYAEGGELTVSPTEKANSLKGQQKLKF